jgi:hypothetical protein
MSARGTQEERSFVMEIDPDRKGFIAIAKIAKPTVETSERYA